MKQRSVCSGRWSVKGDITTVRSLGFLENRLARVLMRGSTAAFKYENQQTTDHRPLTTARRGATLTARKDGVEKRKILVVDDDRKIVDSIRIYFERAGFEVAAAYDGREALRESRANQYDLVILDLMMPEIDGLDVCRRLRAESSIPIIMLTARTTEEDKLRGLDLGADDYVAKPFSPRELVARARAVLRRAAPSQTEERAEIRRGDLVIDLRSREVRVGDKAVILTPTEFDLLAALARSPGRVFTRRELVERALGWDYEGLERTVDAHIKNLRRKLDDASCISTVFGVGYKFFTSEER